ncbi:class I SAM-dependent methyltransferase [Streptomyces sp. NPDC020801]|uniref:class I SAM-dependent methyltransferase n=1 Tax=Streptomyces sp. NPDC020801 TaxID=3365093 RepID=UPI0037A992C5
MASPDFTEREQRLAAVYDKLHAARETATIVSDLYAQAMGDTYPHEINAAGVVDWPLIGTIVGALRLEPGHQLVDLGCGTGGIGLWLARALATHVTGIDISATAVRIATGRARGFLPAGRARFTVGSLRATGLPDRHANGLVCVDALGFELDRTAALREIYRILRPGARAVVTSGRRRTHPVLPPWPEQAAYAGLICESEEERPHEPLLWQRLYWLWIEHETDLRKQLGDEPTDSMLIEARTRGATLDDRCSLTVTLKRPEE